MTAIGWLILVAGVPSVVIKVTLLEGWAFACFSTTGAACYDAASRGCSCTAKGARWEALDFEGSAIPFHSTRSLLPEPGTRLKSERRATGRYKEIKNPGLRRPSASLYQLWGET